MRRFRHIILVAVLCGLSAVAAAGETVFHLIAPDTSKKYVRNIRRNTQDLLSEIQEKWGLTPDSFLVIIASDEEEFQKQVSPDFPSWGVAAAKYPEPSIILRAPGFGRKSATGLRGTIAHELIHLSLLPLIRDKYFPRWMNEGFAQYFAGGESIRQKIIMAQAVSYQSLPTLSKIDDVLKFNEQRASLAYAQSISAFSYLINEFGEEPFRNFLHLLQNEYFDEAFENAYGFDEALFASSWEHWARRHYRPYLLLDVYSYLWSLTPILLMLGWLRMQRRKIRLYREWETGESEDPDTKNGSPEEN